MTITESPVVPAPRSSHRLTTSKAMVEAIELEMDRDPSVFYLGEDVGPYGGIFSSTTGLQEKFGAVPGHRHPDLRDRVHRPGHRRRRRGHAPDRRAHVRRLHGRLPRPDLQPHGQDPLRVGRQRQGADGAHDRRRRRVLRRGAALAVPVGHVRAPARHEGRRAQQPVRRQGTDDLGDPGRQPGRLHVPQGRHGPALDGQEPSVDRRRSRRELHRADRQGQGRAARHRRQRCDAVAVGPSRPGRRRVVGRPGHRRRGDRPP